jgi:hypothetical protein
MGLGVLVLLLATAKPFGVSYGSVIWATIALVGVLMIVEVNAVQLSRSRGMGRDRRSD